MIKRNQTTIRFSPIQGLGLYAARDFDVGDEVFKISGVSITSQKYGSWIFHFDPNKQFGMHWIQVSPEGYVDPSNFGKYLNHCCNPNCGIWGDTLLAARRPIRKGEEITFDYAMSDYDYFDFECGCGVPECRKHVRGFKYLPPEKKLEYKGFVSSYLENMSIEPCTV